MRKSVLLTGIGVAAVLLTTLSGCVTTRHETCAPASIPPGQAVLFSIDGAGGFNATSASLSRVVREEKLPITVVPVDWSHGAWRIVSDETDLAHAQAQGKCLAGRIVTLRRSCGANKVYVVAHSAGAVVALTAAQYLPRDYIDRMVLLAPAVSADYDVRPALRCAREGVDVFTSRRDVLYLGLGVALFGTADRRQTPDAAGRVGFRPIAQSPDDSSLYAKLRQHEWHESVEWTGNRGGHYGTYNPEYLRAYVLPLLYH